MLRRHLFTDAPVGIQGPALICKSTRCRNSTEEKSNSKGQRGRAADVLALVAEHCLPDGVTTLCPSSNPGMPIMAGTRAGDVFCLSMTKQARAHHCISQCDASMVRQRCRLQEKRHLHDDGMQEHTGASGFHVGKGVPQRERLA